jgi:hypothetical protein
MKQLIIDCSKGHGEEDHQITVNIPDDEILKMQAAWKIAENKVLQPSEIEIRLAAIEAKINITQQDKDDALAAITGSEQVKGE